MKSGSFEALGTERIGFRNVKLLTPTVALCVSVLVAFASAPFLALSPEGEAFTVFYVSVLAFVISILAIASVRLATFRVRPLVVSYKDFRDEGGFLLVSFASAGSKRSEDLIVTHVDPRPNVPLMISLSPFRGGLLVTEKKTIASVAIQFKNHSALDLGFREPRELEQVLAILKSPY